MTNFLRALACTAAGVWLGAIILIAIVAQTTFGVMPSTGVERPNTVAGRVMARNFARFDTVQMICGGVLLAAQGGILASARRTRRDALRTLFIAAACGLMLYSAWVMTPRITNMQPAIAAADSESAVKAEFADFHRTAVRLSQINLVLVLVLALELAWPQARKAT